MHDHFCPSYIAEPALREKICTVERSPVWRKSRSYHRPDGLRMAENTHIHTRIEKVRRRKDPHQSMLQANMELSHFEDSVYLFPCLGD